MALLDPARSRKWWLLLLATALIVYCGVMFLMAIRRGTTGLDLMEVVARQLSIPMGLGLVLLFFYLNKPADK